MAWLRQHSQVSPRLSANIWHKFFHENFPNLKIQQNLGFSGSARIKISTDFES